MPRSILAVSLTTPKGLAAYPLRAEMGRVAGLPAPCDWSRPGSLEVVHTLVQVEQHYISERRRDAGHIMPGTAELRPMFLARSRR